MANRELKLIRAANALTKYFGLSTIQDLAAKIAFNSVTGDASNSVETNSASELGILLGILLDTSEGSFSSKDLVRKMKEVVDPNSLDEATIRSIGQKVQIFFAGGDNNFVIPETLSLPLDLAQAVSTKGIREIIDRPDDPVINHTAGTASTLSPTMSVITINSPQISLAKKFVNPITLFFNTVPNIEIQRAVPYVSVEFTVQRPPIDSSGRLLGPTLSKFLLGGIEASGNKTLKAMAIGKSVGNSTQIFGGETVATENFTNAGMEMFTSPQTLVNAESKNIPNIERANPVLDKFRPLMTMREFKVNVVQSTGIMSYKTATLSFVLHDRSRLHEIADFVRPQLYTGTELKIEYGWSHPDGENETANNLYADLINGLRVKEIYRIRNSSFNMDDSGQIIVNIDLFMSGGTDFTTELIMSDSDSITEVMRNITELSRTIGMLRERIFPELSPPGQTREIRGEQILNASQDVFNNLTFTPEFRRQLRELNTGLRSNDPVTRASIIELKEKIEELYGPNISDRRSSRSADRSRYALQDSSAVQALRRTVAEGVIEKIRAIQNGPDPWLTNDVYSNRDGQIFSRDAIKRDAPPATGRDGRALRQRRERSFVISNTEIDNSKPVSLAKLLLHFVARPLAQTHRWSDIQILFYPFNNFSAHARNKNIANFIVDLNYFADEYARFRLNNLSRSANMTLATFLNFIKNILLDDVAAPTYGLDGLYESVAGTGNQVATTRIKIERPDYQTRVESIMAAAGAPGGDFRMPNISFYVETVPEKIGVKEGEDRDSSSNRSILRIHIFDRVTSSYDSLGALLAATKKDQITAIGNGLGVVPTDESASSVGRENSAAWIEQIQRAKEQGIIEYIKEDTGESISEYGSDVSIRVVAGSQRLKEFIMSSVPYIIYGAANTAVVSAQLSSMQDPRLSTVHMLRSHSRRENLRPNGEQPGGMPMRVMPTQLNMDTFGCPFINFAQQFFVDFQTGTTADNIYAVSGLDHSFTPGEFKTSMNLIPLDAWGRYESLVGRLSSAQTILGDLARQTETSEDPAESD